MPITSSRPLTVAGRWTFAGVGRADHPHFDNQQSIIVECPHEPDRVWGGKGVGEAAITPMVSGVGIAVSNAIEMRLFDAPLSPERILKALNRIK